jgi:hypothetical protein
MAYDQNKDLKNEGPDAYDLTVVLRGEENITDHYDGYHSGSKKGWFETFRQGPDGSGNTNVEWDSFVDEDDDIINTDQVIHIGWTTEDEGDEGGDIKDMYWTDQNGDRVDESVVYNMDSGYRYGSPLSVFWANHFDPAVGGQQTMTLSNVKFAISQYRIPLDSLNFENAYLAGLFQDLPGPARFDVPYGDTIFVQIPVRVPSQCALVLRYEVWASGIAQSTDFVQLVPGDEVPSITGWGLIILAVLVLASGIWVVIQRRKTARVRV